VTRHERFQERRNFALADVMGVDYLETPDVGSSFVTVSQDDRIEGFFSDLGSLMPYFEADCSQRYVKALQIPSGGKDRASEATPFGRRFSGRRDPPSCN
jgi:hypothetical protein